MIKIVGLCGSPLKGSTEYVLEQALAAAKAFAPDEIETELISVHGKKISPCVGCGYCKKNKTWCCIKDDMQEIFDKIAHADGLLVASPVYVMTATPQIHAIASRMRPAMHCYPGMLRNKFFAAIAVGGTRNGGQEVTIDDICHLFATRSMNMVSNEVGGYTGAKVWTADGGPEAAAADTIGMKTALDLGGKLAEVCLTYDLGKKALAQREPAR
ncbi:flavodoxin family protein [Pseudoflavonifractor sp. MSJ-37]|uniref:flavodoxin family protein n=1 Tax=Pseudoflavonifractor sp. MSJ-37 TaxID=2841531 RepID=UPI001C1180A5|nr:flavodoxin family protein [Pseudoflavonifractor sp. MSJ-37]MBU5435270.1 flavodoxin family protein [Pseudoflavonifractor sp. MSJ-37]